MKTLVDLDHALRLVWRRPWLSLAVVVVLGAGIGAAVTTFSLFHAVRSRALPYPDGERLVVLREDNPSQDMKGLLTSYQIFDDWREQASSIETLAIGSRVVNVALVHPGEAEPETLVASLVSPEYFASW